MGIEKFNKNDGDKVFIEINEVDGYITNLENNTEYKYGEFISVYTKDKRIINGELLKVYEAFGDARIIVGDNVDDPYAKAIKIDIINDVCLWED